MRNDSDVSHVINNAGKSERRLHRKDNLFFINFRSESQLIILSRKEGRVICNHTRNSPLTSFLFVFL